MGDLQKRHVKIIEKFGGCSSPQITRQAERVYTASRFSQAKTPVNDQKPKFQGFTDMVQEKTN